MELDEYDECKKSNYINLLALSRLRNHGVKKMRKYLFVGGDYHMEHLRISCGKIARLRYKEKSPHPPFICSDPENIKEWVYYRNSFFIFGEQYFFYKEESITKDDVFDMLFHGKKLTYL